MESNVTAAEIAVCTRFGAEADPVPPDVMLGMGRNVRDPSVLPLRAVRHRPANDWSGWMIWRDEHHDDPDFFKPVHAAHAADWVPELLPYLALPPGWGVVLAPNYEDVFHDERILDD